MTMPERHLSLEELNDLVDGQLAPPDAARASLHAAECPACAGRLSELRSLLALARGAYTPPAAPAELWPLVSASTLHWPLVRRRVLRSLRWPLAVAALTIAVLSAAGGAWVASHWPWSSRRDATPGAPSASPELGARASAALRDADAVARALEARADAVGLPEEPSLRQHAAGIRERIARVERARVAVLQTSGDRASVRALERELGRLREAADRARDPATAARRGPPAPIPPDP